MASSRHAAPSQPRTCSPPPRLPHDAARSTTTVAGHQLVSLSQGGGGHHHLPAHLVQPGLVGLDRPLPIDPRYRVSPTSSAVGRPAPPASLTGLNHTNNPPLFEQVVSIADPRLPQPIALHAYADPQRPHSNPQRPPSNPQRPPSNPQRPPSNPQRPSPDPHQPRHQPHQPEPATSQHMRVLHHSPRDRGASRQLQSSPQGFHAHPHHPQDPGAARARRTDDLRHYPEDPGRGYRLSAGKAEDNRGQPPPAAVVAYQVSPRYQDPRDYPHSASLDEPARGHQPEDRRRRSDQLGRAELEDPRLGRPPRLELIHQQQPRLAQHHDARSPPAAATSLDLRLGPAPPPTRQEEHLHHRHRSQLPFSSMSHHQRRSPLPPPPDLRASELLPLSAQQQQRRTPPVSPSRGRYSSAALSPQPGGYYRPSEHNPHPGYSRPPSGSDYRGTSSSAAAAAAYAGRRSAQSGDIPVDYRAMSASGKYPQHSALPPSSVGSNATDYRLANSSSPAVIREPRSPPPPGPDGPVTCHICNLQLQNQAIFQQVRKL